MSSSIMLNARRLLEHRDGHYVKFVLSNFEIYGTDELFYMPQTGITTTPMGMLPHVIPGRNIDNYYLCDRRVVLNLKTKITLYLDLPNETNYRNFREAYTLFNSSIILSDYFVKNKEFIGIYIMNLRKYIDDIKAKNFIYFSQEGTGRLVYGRDLSVDQTEKLLKKCAILHDIMNCLIRKYLDEMDVARAMVA